MLVTSTEIKDLINNIERQVTFQINEETIDLKLDTRDALALVGLLQKTITTNCEAFGYDYKGRRGAYYARE